jgi:hypothetical protein
MDRAQTVVSAHVINMRLDKQMFWVAAPFVVAQVGNVLAIGRKRATNSKQG